MNFIITVSSVLLGGILANLSAGSSVEEGAFLRKRQLQDNKNDLCPTGRKTPPTRYIVKPSGDQFSEVSWIAHSKQTYEGHPVMWMGSDGSQSEISAVDLATGDVIQTYLLDVEKGFDWESIGLGPCKSRGRKICLYIGAIGNNAAWGCRDRKCTKGRDEVQVYKFLEPDVNAVDWNIRLTTLRLNYHHPDLPTNRADAESLFVDFTGDNKGGNKGDIYIVTKFPENQYLQRITKVPVSVHEGFINADLQFSVIPVGTPVQSKDHLWTGADMTTDGTLIALRGYSRIRLFPRLPTETVADALSVEPCFESESILGPHERAFEAVSFDGQNRLAEASECDDARSCNVAVTVWELENKDMK